MNHKNFEVLNKINVLFLKQKPQNGRPPLFPNFKPQNRRHPLSLKWNKKKKKI